MRDQGNWKTLQGADRNDQKPIDFYFDRYYIKIYRYLFYKIGDNVIAEDLASEVFARLLRANNPGSLDVADGAAWLFKTAHNLAIDHIRSQQTRQAEILDETLPSSDISLEKTVEQNLDSQALYQAIKTLPDDHAEVIILRFINNMSIADSAQAMGRSQDAIKSLQRRALLSLRQVLKRWEVNYG